MLLKYEGAQVMGIINVTPDSFFEGSRCQGEENLRKRVRQIIEEGGTMIDLGAYSTRPDADEVSAEEELSRLAFALPIIIDELNIQKFRNSERWFCLIYSCFCRYLPCRGCQGMYLEIWRRHHQ